jgi:predicted metal-dependent hydrolase
MKEDYILVHDKKHPVCILIEKRKTSRASIGRKGVYIRIPEHLPSNEKQKHIRRFKDWAYRKLLTNPQLSKRKEQIRYANGDTIRIRDESYTIMITHKDKKTSSGRIVGNEVRLSLSSKLRGENLRRHVSILLNRCFAKWKLRDLEERVSMLNDRFFGFTFGRVSWKNTKSRWGSCSPCGNLNFSTRLLLAPEEVMDYVIIHELAHIRFADHSKHFWRLVSGAMPSWKEKRKWLRTHQDACRM